MSNDNIRTIISIVMLLGVFVTGYINLRLDVSKAEMKINYIEKAVGKAVPAIESLEKTIIRLETKLESSGLVKPDNQAYSKINDIDNVLYAYKERTDR